MVGAPVLFGTLLALLAAALAPTPVPRVATSSEAASAGSAAGTLPTPEPPSRTAAAPEEPTRAPADVSAIEAKPANQLSVEEVLTLHGARAQKKLEKVRALSQKLDESPEAANDAQVQAQLFYFAADADTAAEALVAMTHARAPVGADLLYEVWSNRSASPGTTELARALLQSPSVRAGASPALAVAIELRAAEQCEAIEAALPKVQSDGDRRALPLLAKLNVKRGCGPDKKDDCFACLRSHTKQVLATANAVKKRNAPSYPARSAP